MCKCFQCRLVDVYRVPYTGAYPPSSFHWPTLGLNNNSLPLLSPEDALGLYWGFQLSTFRGSQAHDAFLTNVALGRLDVYTYDLWNMHECGGGLPQFGMPDYNTSFRRWSINAIAFTRTRCKSKILTRRDDEAFVSVNWPIDLEPHRVAFVGESLVVHAALLTQRNASHPFNFMGRFGMVEEWIIPVYTELARQYTSVPFGQWKGNLSFLDYYESVLVGLGQRLWSEDPWLHCKAGRSDWFAPHCKGIAVENVTGADIRSPVDRTSNASEHTTL